MLRLTILARLRRHPSRLDAVDELLLLNVNERGRSVQTRRESAVAARGDAADREREGGQLVERLRQVCRVVEAHDTVGATGNQGGGPGQRPQRVLLGWTLA